MLKQQARLLTRIAIAVDAVMIMVAFIAAYLIMENYTHLAGWGQYDWILLLMVPGLLLLMWYFNLYATLRTRRITDIFFDLVKVHIIGTIILSSSIFLIDPRGFSRLLFGASILLSLVLILSAKVIIKLILFKLRRHGFNVRYLLLAGCNETSAELIKTIREHSEWGLVISGVTEDQQYEEDTYCGIPIVGRTEDLLAFCRDNPVDEVIWCLEHGTEEQEDIFYHALKSGITFRSVLDYSSRPTTRTDLSLFHGQFQILTFYSKEFNSGQLFAKRCLDIAGAIVGLAITAVLYPFIALAIRLDSPGPIVFGQMRLGENGRMFRCWKFRSMYIDAEERKKELMARNEMNGAMFKIADDPRVTKVGRVIRKTSLDELLQFWNVLMGDMSLVGTRPPTPDEVKNYKHWHRKRICIKPGITGLWQVSGRNQIKDFDEVADLDINYIDKWSLWMDFRILFKTVWVVFARSGAS